MLLATRNKDASIHQHNARLSVQDPPPSQNTVPALQQLDSCSETHTVALLHAATADISIICKQPKSTWAQDHQQRTTLQHALQASTPLSARVLVCSQCCLVFAGEVGHHLVHSVLSVSDDLACALNSQEDGGVHRDGTPHGSTHTLPQASIALNGNGAPASEDTAAGASVSTYGVKTECIVRQHRSARCYHGTATGENNITTGIHSL